MAGEHLSRWAQIDRGERALTWADFIGDPSASPYLREPGRRLAEQMAADFESYFRPPWLPRALGTTGRAPLIPTLGKMCPALSLGPQSALAAHVELISWWARIIRVGAASVQGHDVVRKDIRSDLTLERLLHALTQLRLAAVASTPHRVPESAAGAAYERWPNGVPTIQLENRHGSGDRAGDVSISWGHDTANIEVFALRSGGRVERGMSSNFDAVRHLRDLERDADVHASGDLPHLLDSTDMTNWMVTVARSAATVDLTGLEVIHQHAHGQLAIRPGPAPVGNELTGPLIEIDQGARIKRRLEEKAQQSSGSRSVWLWLENHGVLDWLTPFTAMPMDRQVELFAELCEQAMRAHRHVEGIVMSTAGRRTWPPLPAEDVTSDSTCAVGLGRSIALDRRRVTLIWSRANIESHPLTNLVHNEPTWLDDALETLGWPGLDELVYLPS